MNAVTMRARLKLLASLRSSVARPSATLRGASFLYPLLAIFLFLLEDNRVIHCGEAKHQKPVRRPVTPVQCSYITTL
jgi:hypothetical protein